MPRHVDEPTWRHYTFLRTQMGMNISQAAKDAGVDRSAASKFEKGELSSSGSMIAGLYEELKAPPVKERHDLSPLALDCLDDFERFRYTFMGHVSQPWHIEAAQDAIRFLNTRQREFTVVNCPPGAGKTTLFSHDIPAWLTARDRGIRGMLGHRVSTKASESLVRLRRTLERVQPPRAGNRDLARGTAVDATHALVMEYGRFKPIISDTWTKTSFVVAQIGDQTITEKEATWYSVGQDATFIGHRVDFAAWDDTVDKTTIRTIEAALAQQEWWDNEAEQRVEDWGALFLVGQRLSARDLYRYNLDKLAGVDDDTLYLDFDEEVTDEEIENLDLNAPDGGFDPVTWRHAPLASALPRAYRHIVFKAHYDDKCNGRATHQRNAPAYPDGCLLDPLRLPYRDLARVKINTPDRFATVFQQEDIDAATQLVDPLWVSGGEAVDGQTYIGCWDNTRDLCELPKGIQGKLLSIAVTDPSPTKFWAIQWWVYHPDSEQRFLMDLRRQSMESTDFLDRDGNSGLFTGIMEDWWVRSAGLHLPITHWIVEKNVAQRFMLQYNHTKDWSRLRNVTIVQHETYAQNKLDPEMGVQSLKNKWRSGQVRLPGSPMGRARIESMKLVDEATRYPNGVTDDELMAQWMLEFNLPNLSNRRIGQKPYQQSRPSWINNPPHTTRGHLRVVS